MNEEKLKDEMTRTETAAYLDCMQSTIEAWHSKKLYDLKPQMKRGRMMYRRAVIDKFMGDNGSGPMLNTKNAARFLGRSPHTLQKWRHKRRNLKPAKVGRFIRYRISELEKFRQADLRP